MTKYYLIKLLFKGSDYYLIWFSDDIDGLLIENQRLLVFSSVDEAKIFASNEHIVLENGITDYDLSHFTELINNTGISKNCGMLIDIWNLFSDLSKSLNEHFAGDDEDEETIDIYNKLFYGCNLELLETEEYHPNFDDDEKNKCYEIFKSGMLLLDKYLKPMV